MSQPLYLLLPGDPNSLTGGYIYDRRITSGLRQLGWQVEVRTLAAGFPHPDPADLAHAAAQLRAIPDDARVLIDGLALGAMPAQVAAERDRLRLIGLVHHPLALETGLTPAQAARLRRTETAALAAMRLVLVTSPSTARLLMAQFAVPAARLRISAPGTDPAPLARGQPSGPLQLLCVATLTPRKGHQLLIEALAALADRAWGLTCIGSLARCPATTAAVRALIRTHALEARVQLTGEVDAATLQAAYAGADLFVLPSLYEGYGMAFTEALARGLPVLGTRAGALAQTIPPEAGLLVEPGSLPGLTSALARLLDDQPLRARLAAGARRVRARLPDWQRTCTRLAGLLQHV